jgi:hypothetical protein
MFSQVLVMIRAFAKRHVKEFRYLAEISLILFSGTIVLHVIGILANPTPMGDDAIFTVSRIQNLAQNFPNILWNPYAFNGYDPTIFYPWSVYLIPALLVAAGFNPILVFHFDFVISFLLLGLSIYYLCLKLGTNRLVAISMPLIIWSTNAFWNNSIWGGAYERIFDLPYMFSAFTLTYNYISCLERNQNPRFLQYVAIIVLWILTICGNIFIAMMGLSVAFPFVMFSSGLKRIVTGLRLALKIFLPIIALLAWYFIPFLEHIQKVGTIPQDVTPDQISWLVYPGPAWTSTLSVIYLPMVLFLGIALIVLTSRYDYFNFQVQFGSEKKSLLFSTSLAAGYFLIMGYIKPAWTFLPRIVATYDSITALSLILLIMIALLSSVVCTSGHGKLTKSITAFFLVLVIVNAALTIPSIKPINWNPTQQTLDSAIMSRDSLSSSFRISLGGRILTRSFPYYYPNISDTGGRLSALNPDPFYESLYETEIFYKGNLGSISTTYVDDAPPVNVSTYLGDSSNYAENSFWFDWYATKSAVFLPFYYSMGNTINGYADRPAFFSTAYLPIQASTPFALSSEMVVVSNNNSGPILSATNAPLLGFYSTSPQVSSEYASLIALLSYLGLSSQYVVPVELPSINNSTAKIVQGIVTDSSTFTQQSGQFEALVQRGVTVDVFRSKDNPGNFPNFNRNRIGNGSLNLWEISIGQLMEMRELGSYQLVQSFPSMFQIQTVIPGASIFHSQNVFNLYPKNWIVRFSKNVYASSDVRNNTLIVSLANQNSSSVSEVNLDQTLVEPILISADSKMSFSVFSNANLSLEVLLKPVNSSNYLDTNTTVKPGQWINLSVPFPNPLELENPDSRFALADQLDLIVHATTDKNDSIIEISNATVSTPSYSISNFSSATDFSKNGFVNLSETLPSGSVIEILNSQGSIIDTYSGKRNDSSVISFESFNSTSKNDLAYKALIISPQNINITSLDRFLEADWVSVTSQWLNDETLLISGIPAGYEGLVWKETFTNSWSISAPITDRDSVSLGYLLAGPGFVFIPLIGNLNRVIIHYDPYSFPESVSLMIAVITLLFLASVPVSSFIRRFRDRLD